MNSHKPLLYYTGHPFIDVGIATITAYTQQTKKHIQSPEEVELDDLRNIAEYLRDQYSHIKKLQNYLNVFFQGAHFTQPAKSLEDKLVYANRLLFAFEEDVPKLEDIKCTFFPDKPAVMYAHRQYFPLLNGALIGNFSPLGSRGIPVSGEAMLAIHALPLGCLKCGNPLALHQTRFIEDPSPDMNFIFARQALITNLKAILEMQLNPDAEIPNLGSYIKTRYVDAILKAKQTLQSRRVDTTRVANITGYYFTNFANRANLELVRLDNAVLDFVNVAQQDASTAWQRVVYLGWQPPKNVTEPPNEENTQTWRNSMYETLFELPRNAVRFVQHLKHGDWHLIEIFLRKVMQMDQERIDTYRELGDRLAEYMLNFEEGASGFYYKFSRADSYTKLRGAVRSASERMFKAKTEQPLFTYDEFILAFEYPGDMYKSWRLARDLISIRMLEILHQKGFDTSELPDDFGDIPEEDEE